MENKNIIKIDPKEMTLLAQKGEAFIFKPEAESALLRLHETILMLQALEDRVKQQIGILGKELNPNFKGVLGDKVRCIYRKFGAKYEYDWKKKADCEPFLKKKEYFSVDADKVDKYFKETNEPPMGISEKAREETLSISYGGAEDEENPLIA